jgi:hypothetical protein
MPFGPEPILPLKLCAKSTKLFNSRSLPRGLLYEMILFVQVKDLPGAIRMGNFNMGPVDAILMRNHANEVRQRQNFEKLSRSSQAQSTVR